MKVFKLAITLVLVTVSYARLDRFYDDPQLKHYYSYHPYRHARSMEAPKSLITFQGDFGNITNCTYSKTLQSLKCDGVQRSITCNTTINISNLSNVTYDLFGLGLINDGIFVSTKVFKYEMLPFKKVYSNETMNLFSYQPSNTGFNLYQSSLIKEKGLRVQDLECFNDLISLLDESRLMKNLKFKIDLLNKEIFGTVNAKLSFLDYF